MPIFKIKENETPINNMVYSLEIGVLKPIEWFLHCNTKCLILKIINGNIK